MNSDEINSLSHHGVFGGQQLKGTMVETHISWVILSRQFAFKIKKPLKLSFLDFSTIDLRKKYCQKELFLNRRFSSIYLQVLPVKERHGSLYIGPQNGRIIDYCVQMKRLNNARRMDRLLEVNEVPEESVVQLARRIANFHKRAKVVNKRFSLRRSRATFNDIRSTIGLCTTHLGAAYSMIVERSILWNENFLQQHSQRMRERVLNGFCRDVHGDLHSGNIFLYKSPILFDCIDFNDTFREIDILDELAFLCMDLEAHQKSGMAKLFLKAYRTNLECIFNAEDKLLFNYFKCCRANVRAKVSAVGATQAQDDRTYRQSVRAWKKYLRLMKKYTKL